jgi:hypothetical protein
MSPLLKASSKKHSFQISPHKKEGTQMSRDKTGKNQETAQVASNTAQAGKDLAGRDTQIASEDSAIQGLEANPGLGPEFMTAAKARNADVMNASYGGAADALQRTSATTGHFADDTGLYPQEAQLAGSKAIAQNSADQDYNLKDAQAKLQTRQMIPGMYQAPASLLGGSANNLTGQNTSLISGRTSADNTNTFGQQMLLAGTQAAGQAATGKL